MLVAGYHNAFGLPLALLPDDKFELVDAKVLLEVSEPPLTIQPLSVLEPKTGSFSACGSSGSLGYIIYRIISRIMRLFQVALPVPMKKDLL